MNASIDDVSEVYEDEYTPHEALCIFAPCVYLQSIQSITHTMIQSISLFFVEYVIESLALLLILYQ